MKYKFSMCRTIATLFVISILIAPILIGAGAYIFINIPSFVVTFGLCFFMLLAVYEIEFLKFITHALGVFFCKPLESNARFAQIALFGSRSIVGAGVIGMLIGIIQMLSNLSDPSGIGVGMATALTCPFYAIIISEIFFAVVHQSFKEISAKTDDVKNTLPMANAGLSLLAVFLSLTVFSIIMFTLGGFNP